MIVEEAYYLEHYGKKGMKWGVRGGRKAHPRSAEEEARRKEIFGKVKKGAKIAAVVGVVGVGALAAAKYMGAHGSTKLADIPQAAKPNPAVSNAIKAASAKRIADLKESHNKLMDAANADLIRRDKLMEIPIRDRTYLTKWA